MRRSSWPLVAGFVATVVVYAGLSRVWLDTDSAWYRGLDKPWFQPPDVVFGIIWPLNYLALLVVGVLVALREPAAAARRMLVVLAASVVLALGWSYLFSEERRPGAAAVALVGAAVLTWVLVALAGRARWWYAALLLAYAGWMTLAASLSVGIAVLN
jgi:tryptophan-rich sensory protein